MTGTLTPTAQHAELVATHSAHNYDPLPVVVAHAEGAHVTDVEGRRYLDLLAGYSALNFGHRHPALVAAAAAQLERVTLTSRAFGSDQLGPFCAELAALVGPLLRGGHPLVLPMNTGAEAVESGLKVARKWGYEVKGVVPGRAEVVVAAGNFHGRTTTIVGFSTDPQARAGFGPFAPGFRIVPYGDAAAVRAALTPDTVAVLIEPVQGEAGVVVPPPGYLPALRALCDEHDVLLVADEVQSGLGRTGTVLACEHWGVRPDVVLLGKALGGGIVPVSAVVADEAVLGVLRPGDHGSTFGGNPLACAVGRAVIALLAEPGGALARARELGVALHAGLGELVGHGVGAVRGLGPWAGVDVVGPDGRPGSARAVCERLAARGVLAKDTHGATLRLSPPLVTTPAEIREALDALRVAVQA